MVKVLGGADISWIVGFAVAGSAYLISSWLAGRRAPHELATGSPGDAARRGQRSAAPDHQ
jgi:hypothetical protein